MAYNTIYYATFPDRTGSTINLYIKQKDYAGASEKLLLSEDPIIVSTANRYYPETIYGTGATISIVNDSSNLLKYTTLFGDTEKQNYILITKDTSTKIFEGYIYPDLFSQEIKQNSLVSMPGTNYLSQLDKKELTITQPTYLYTYTPGGFNAENLLHEAIWATDLSLDIAVNNKIRSDQMVISDTSTLFDYILINRNLYVTETGESKDSKFVLESILKTFYSRIYYYNGKWYIERIKDILTRPKTFTNYGANGVVSSFTVPNDRISLCSTNYLINQNTISYESGKKKVRITRNNVKSDNVINKNICDLEVSTGERPNYGQWIFHVDLESEVPHILHECYKDRNITNGVKITDTDAATHPYQWDRYLSTKIAIHPAEFNRYTVSYRYSFATQHGKDNRTYCASFRLRAENVDDPTTFSYVGTYLDILTNEYKFKWYDERDFNTGQEELETATYFTTCWTQSDIDPHKGVLEVSVDIDLSDLLLDGIYAPNFIDRTSTSVPPKLFSMMMGDLQAQAVKYLWIDIHPLTYRIINSNQAQNQTSGSRNKLERTDTFNYYYTFNYPNPYPYYNNILPYYDVTQYFGDIAIDAQIDQEYDILEGDISTNYIDTFNVDLDIFDVVNDIYINGIYTMDASGILIKQSYWNDDSSVYALDPSSFLPIQKLLIQDLFQQFCKPRFKLELDVKCKDASLFNMGNVFTYSYLTKDGSLMEFIPTGIEYNVQANSYRLNLLEAVRDSDYRSDAITYPYMESNPQFYLDPSDLYFYASGAAKPVGSNSINVSTNIFWYATSPFSDNWIHYNGYNDGFFYAHTYDLSVYVDPNPAVYNANGVQIGGLARDGSIYFHVIGFLDPVAYANVWKIVTVHQDAGINPLTVNMDKTLFMFDPSGLSCYDASIYVYANTPWYATFGDTWVTGDDVSAEGSAVITFSVNDNAGASRSTTIYFSAYADPGINDHCFVVQKVVGQNC